MPVSTIIIRTVMAVVIGGVIGLERQSKHRPAGFRTHILVCLGSMTVMLLSEQIFIKYYTLYGTTSDPQRMAAQVVSGIGFLGAGTIIHFGTNVKGLTTAASLWAVATIGLTIGAGFFVTAIIVSSVLYATLLMFNKISLRINKSGNILELVITLVNKPKALGAINLLLAKNNAKILDMSFIKSDMEDYSGKDTKVEGIINVRVVAQLDEGASFVELMDGIRSINGIIDVERV